ncbi:hypothetical protein [Thermithiobacillus plumbiphilus]|uniref:hypothetical protein n=1 Tax=Thermithiobacillus plumbiphilus TaxID=1729899 RepID=UPI003BF9A005
MDTAIAVLLDDAQPIGDIDCVALNEACDRVLALPQTAPVAVPPMDNSAMDWRQVWIAVDNGQSAILRLVGSLVKPASKCKP